MMKPCFLKIVTVVDGEESIFLQEAEMELFSESAKLRYFENQTQTAIASRLGISQVQVSRLEKKILREMRERMMGE